MKKIRKFLTHQQYSESDKNGTYVSKCVDENHVHVSSNIYTMDSLVDVGYVTKTKTREHNILFV